MVALSSFYILKLINKAYYNYFLMIADETLQINCECSLLTSIVVVWRVFHIYIPPNNQMKICRSPSNATADIL